VSFDAVMAKVAADIERIGWSAIGVFPVADDPPERRVSYVYSVGFREFDEHPEMIVLGLEFGLGHALLAELFERIHEGERFTDAQVDGEVLKGFDVEFRELAPDGRPLNVARRHYGLDELPALQIVWPDQNGWFPGDDACDERIERAQDLALALDDNEGENDATKP
jgi:hypothetical protein